MGRSYLLFAMLLAAVGIPYVWRNGAPQSLANLADSMWHEAEQTTSTDNPYYPVPATSPPMGGAYSGATGYPPYGTEWTPVSVAPSMTASPTSEADTGPSVYGPAVQSFGDIFRFDVTPAWIMNHWAQVSTRIMDEDMEGYRVTLVSGTGNYDLIGSLTYYFNRNQQVDRISFDGHTPDPAGLVDFLMGHYGLQSEPVLGAGLYLRRDGEKIIHVLRVQHARVIRSNSPYQRFVVRTELNRPGTRSLGPSFAQLLRTDQRSRRWQPPEPHASSQP